MVDFVIGVLVYTAGFLTAALMSASKRGDDMANKSDKDSDK